MKNKARNLRKLQSLLTAVFIVGMIFTATSCKDDEGELEEIVASDPEITNIMESSGYIGDEVTINGLNFNDGASETVVKFGTVSADVTGGTTTTIETSVPDGVSFGSVDVTVTVSDLVSESESFTVLDSDDSVTVVVDPMTFSGFVPTEGVVGTTVVITGENFDSDVKVYINGVEQTDVTYDSDTQISITVAAKSGTGIVELERGDDLVSLETLFMYEYTDFSNVEDFSDYEGIEILALDDGSAYICYSSGLIKVDASGELESTLIDASGGGMTMKGLFLADDGVLYIADGFGRILLIEDGSNSIDTLVDTETPNNVLVGARVWQITGDNKGYLYYTNYFEEVIKVSINDKTSDTLVSAAGNKTFGIDYLNDSLYVTGTKGLFRVSLSGDGLTYIKEFASTSEGSYLRGGMCHTPNGDIYFTGGDYPSLYKVHGNEVEKVLTDSGLGITGTSQGISYSKGSLYVTGNVDSKKIILE